MKIPSTLKDQIDLLSNSPGVYLFTDKSDTIIYIGKADRLKERVKSYIFSGMHPHPRTKRLVQKIETVRTVVTSGRREALVLEATLIRRHRPRYNVNLRDGQRYPYVCFTGGSFPRIEVTRVSGENPGPCFGPYTDVKSLRAVLRLLRAAIPLRTCSDREMASRKKACVLYHMKRCLAPCVIQDLELEYKDLVGQTSKILQGRVGTAIRELKNRMFDLAQRLRFEEAAVLRERIDALAKLSERQRVVLKLKKDLDIVAVAFSGSASLAVVQQVREGCLVGQRAMPLRGAKPDSDRSEVLEAVLSQYYISSSSVPPKILLASYPSGRATLEEWFSEGGKKPVRLVVPKRGIGAELVRGALENAKRLLEEEIARAQSWERRVPGAVVEVGEILGMYSPPRIIVGMDVSNLSGREAVGSVVVFREGVPWKKGYRRYKLHDSAPDDIGMMREMACRWTKRVETGEIEAPDLLLVDGGQGQVNVVLETCEGIGFLEKTVFIGLAKRDEVVYRRTPMSPLVLDTRNEALRLLQRVRDEAHRFAVTYHRKIRRKGLLRSALEQIPGVGKTRASALQQSFGGLEGLRLAALDDIVGIHGIGPKLAETIKRAVDRS